MVAGHRVDGNGAVDLRSNSKILRGLSRVARLVDQVATDNHKSGMQSVDVRDGELIVGGFLNEVFVTGESSKLRVRQLNEEKLAGVLCRRCGSGQ